MLESIRIVRKRKININYLKIILNLDHDMKISIGLRITEVYAIVFVFAE